MGKLEEKIKKIYKRGIISTTVIFLIGMLFLIPGFLIYTRNPEDSSIEFNKYTTEYEYSKVDVKYLMGPFAEETENGRTTKEFYVAEGPDKECFVIATKKNTDIPIYGVDVSDNDLKKLESIRIYGYADPIDTKLQQLLLETFNSGLEEDEKLDTNTCIQWLGQYYIDTTKSPHSMGLGMSIFGGILLFVGITAIFTTKKMRKNQREAIAKMDNWDDIKEDYDTSSIIEYKKIGLELGNKYLYDFIYGNGITIIAYKDVLKVYASNMYNGKINQMCTFITIETKNNKKYSIAPKPINKKVAQFEEAINAIKEKISVE